MNRLRQKVLLVTVYDAPCQLVQTPRHRACLDMHPPALPRACLKIHSRRLHAPLRGIFGPDSVSVARYASIIGTKSPTKWDAQPTESNFQTRSKAGVLRQSVCRWVCPLLRISFHIQSSRCLQPWGCRAGQMYGPGCSSLRREWIPGNIQTIPGCPF